MQDHSHGDSPSHTTAGERPPLVRRPALPRWTGASRAQRSLLTDGSGIPLGVGGRGGEPARLAAAAPHRGELARFGFHLPEQITVHLDAGYDSTPSRDLLDELGCAAQISTKGTPLQAGARWVVEPTNSWHNRGFKKLHVCTERRAPVIEAFIALANAIIIVRRLLWTTWTSHRWDTRPTRRP